MDSTRRTWRAAAGTLVVVWLFAVTAAVVIPLLAYLIHRNEGSPVIAGVLVVLTALALAYAWRFGLHPRLVVTDREITVVNPFARRVVDWNDVTVIAPGENGLVVGTEEGVVEAWCVQKSNAALRRGRRTRADGVAAELMAIWDRHDPPLEDEETGLRGRRARPHESRLLTRIERAASEGALEHVFPSDEHPFPVTAVTRRWARLLRDPTVRVHLLELHDEPAGYVAFDPGRVRHLGVSPDHQRRGFGSALLAFATQEIFDRGAHTAELWVPADDLAARQFCRSHGWRDTEERRRIDHPPRPEELRMTRDNPVAPRRSRG